LRDYDMPGRAELARRLAAHCRRHRLRLLIAGDARLAAAVRADGVHYSESAALRMPRRPTRRPHLVTVACHGTPSLRRALARKADACILSPVFETASHPGVPHIGHHRFARLVRSVNLPVYALGGINHRTVRRLAESGACGIAAISALSVGNL